MLRQLGNRILTYRFESMPREALVHAVFARVGGVSKGPFSSLNVGNKVGDDPESVSENHRLAFAHLGLDASQVVTAQQVHGNRVALVNASAGGNILPSTDGLVTSSSVVALMLRFADCQPIILFDPIQHALGLVHSGWRGVALGIAYRAVEMMSREFGTLPRDLVAGLGPAIGPCCYTVGDDVAAAMGYALPDWHGVLSPEADGWKLDLPAANGQQLAGAGVQTIEYANICTACHSDEFFSHRASQGNTGRFAVLAYLQPSSLARQPGPTRTDRLESEEPDPVGIMSLSPPGMPGFDEQSGEQP